MLIIRSVASHFHIRRCDLCKRILFAEQVGIEVNICSLNGFVIQLKSDQRAIDAGSKQFHGDGHGMLFVLFSEMNRFAQRFRLIESAGNGPFSDFGNHGKRWGREYY